MNPGDILMIYTDPINLKAPQGQAKLIKYNWLADGGLELWDVEFLDQPGKVYPRLIKPI